MSARDDLGAAEFEDGAMRPVTKFTLPETHAAFAEWSARTGFDWDSPEWGEVLAALDSCDLLIADRVPQRGLFDAPDSPLGDGPQVRRLRAAIVASGRLHTSGWGYDLATSAQVVAAVLERFYADVDTAPFDDLMARLEGELAVRVRSLGDSPSELLARLMGTVPEGHSRGLRFHIESVAMTDDEFAVRVFERLAAAPGWGLSLVPLCDGRWITYQAGEVDGAAQAQDDRAVV